MGKIDIVKVHLSIAYMEQVIADKADDFFRDGTRFEMYSKDRIKQELVQDYPDVSDEDVQQVYEYLIDSVECTTENFEWGKWEPVRKRLLDLWEKKVTTAT